MVADYGIPEAVLDQRALMMQGRMRVQLRKTGELIDKLSTLTREESRIAYMWMNADNPQASDYLMQQLPPESIQTLAEVEKMIDRLPGGRGPGPVGPRGLQAQPLRLLAPVLREAHRRADPGEAKRRGGPSPSLGDQYKGRGMVEGVAMRQIQNVAPEWWGRKFQGGKADKGLKNERFIRLERREPAGEGTTPIPGIGDRTPGACSRWPTGPPANPCRPSSRTGTRLAPGRCATPRATSSSCGATSPPRNARPWARSTRHALPSPRPCTAWCMTWRWALPEWLAQRHAKKDGAGLNVVKASEKMKDTFAPGEWVEVPDTKIPARRS